MRSTLGRIATAVAIVLLGTTLGAPARAQVADEYIGRFYFSAPPVDAGALLGGAAAAASTCTLSASNFAGDLYADAFKRFSETYYVFHAYSSTWQTSDCAWSVTTTGQIVDTAWVDVMYPPRHPGPKASATDNCSGFDLDACVRPVLEITEIDPLKGYDRGVQTVRVQTTGSWDTRSQPTRRVGVPCVARTWTIVPATTGPEEIGQAHDDACS
jgi:hypothetical protein